MLGLGTNLIKGGGGVRNIVTDSLVLRHDYTVKPVQPLSDGAASFNGTSDYIAINAKPVDTADGTYCWWSNSTQTSKQTIFAHGSNKIGGFHLNFQTTNKPLLYLESTLYQYWVDTGFADDGKWHHWALVVDIDDMTACKLYCDGVEIAQSTTNPSGTATSYGNMEIGRYDSSNEFEGYICNFGVWSSHLTQPQIKSIMNKNYAGLSESEKTDLVSWWNLDSVIPNTTTFVYDNHYGGGDILGSELVDDGDFSLTGTQPASTAGTYWSTGSKWTISGGKATLESTDSGGSTLTQTSVFTVDKVYKITFDAEVTEGSVKIEGSGGSGVLTIDTTKTYEFYWTAPLTSLIFNRISATTSATISNVSAKLVNGNPGTLS